MQSLLVSPSTDDDDDDDDDDDTLPSPSYHMQCILCIQLLEYPIHLLWSAALVRKILIFGKYKISGEIWIFLDFFAIVFGFLCDFFGFL